MKVKNPRGFLLQVLVSCVPVWAGWYYAWHFVNRFYGLSFAPRRWWEWTVAGAYACTRVQPVYAVTSVFTCQVLLALASLLGVAFIFPGGRDEDIDVVILLRDLKERCISAYHTFMSKLTVGRITGAVLLSLMLVLLAIPLAVNSVSVVCVLRHFMLDRYVILASTIILGLLTYFVPYLSVEQGLFSIVLYMSFMGSVLKDAILVSNCIGMQELGIAKPIGAPVAVCGVTNSVTGNMVTWRREGSNVTYKNQVEDMESAFQLASMLAFLPVVVRLLMGLTWERMAHVYMRNERFGFLFDRPKWHTEELRAIDRRHFLANLIQYACEVADTASVINILKVHTEYNFELFFVILAASTVVHFVMSPSGLLYHLFGRAQYSSYIHYQMSRKAAFICQNVVYIAIRIYVLSHPYKVLPEPLCYLFLLKGFAFAAFHLMHIFLLRKNLKRHDSPAASV